MKQNRYPTNATARMQGPMRRLTAVLLITLTLLAILSLPASAARAVRVTVGGKEIAAGKARIIDSTTYVPFRAFANDVASGSKVTWNASTRTAKMVSGSTTVTAAVGQKYIVKNGSRISSPAQNRLIGGTLYVPVRPMASALGYSVSWNARTYTVALTKSGSGNPSGSNGSNGSSGSSGSSSNAGSTYSSTDLYWLSRIIQAEAGGEPYRGKLAVGTVIMNRVKSSKYPNTVYGVIFDKKNGVQFTPTSNGKIYNTPSSDSVAAAKAVLTGTRISGNIQYFLNPAIASDTWFRRNLTYVCTIGSHAFYAP